MSTQLHTVVWHTRCASVTSRFAVALQGVSMNNIKSTIARQDNTAEVVHGLWAILMLFLVVNKQQEKN